MALAHYHPRALLKTSGGDLEPEPRPARQRWARRDHDALSRGATAGVERGLDHARHLRSDTARAGLLGRLLPYLSTTDRASALAEAIGIARNESAIDSSWSYVQVVAGHPMPVPDTMLRDARAVAASVQDDDEHLAWVLGELATRLGPVLTTAVALAAGVKPEDTRASISKQLVPHLGGEQRAPVTALCRALSDDYERAHSSKP